MNYSLKWPGQLQNLTPPQIALRDDETHRFIMTTAGRRSRKTIIAMRKIWKWACSIGELRFFHGAPTRQQAKDIFWKRLKKNTKPIWARSPNETELYVTLLNGSEIHVIGLDRPERIEGQPWDGCHITEMGNVKNMRETWESNIRPVLADTNGKAILDGVPEMGVTEYREMAQYACGGTIPTTVPFNGAFGENKDDPEWAFYTWFSADVLPAKEIESAKRQMDPKLFKQEFEGSFETLEGMVYYGFTADYYPHGNLDESVKYDKNLPVYVGMDFNVSPMSALLCHFITAKDGINKGELEIHVFKGYFLKNSNTRQLAEMIVTDYPDAQNFIITMCQSSAARQTSQEMGKTDRRILKDVFASANRNMRPFNRTKNPLVKNRTNATNSIMYHNRVRINPNDKGIQEWRKDLEGLTWKKGTSDIDLSDKMRGHISAGFDYLAERHFPVLQPDLGIIDTGIIV